MWDVVRQQLTQFLLVSLCISEVEWYLLNAILAVDMVDVCTYAGSLGTDLLTTYTSLAFDTPSAHVNIDGLHVRLHGQLGANGVHPVSVYINWILELENIEIHRPQRN